MTGDEVLIDGMPVGNLFAFGWNSESRRLFYRSETNRNFETAVLVSMSFQFVGKSSAAVLHGWPLTDKST
jgi:hypothetical protein